MSLFRSKSMGFWATVGPDFPEERHILVNIYKYCIYSWCVEAQVCPVVDQTSSPKWLLYVWSVEVFWNWRRVWRCWWDGPRNGRRRGRCDSAEITKNWGRTGGEFPACALQTERMYLFRPANGSSPSGAHVLLRWDDRRPRQNCIKKKSFPVNYGVDFYW